MDTCDIVFELIGFNDEQLKCFLEKCIQKQESINMFMKEFNNQSYHMKSMCRVPILALAIYALYEKDKSILIYSLYEIYEKSLQLINSVKKLPKRKKILKRFKKLCFKNIENQIICLELNNFDEEYLKRSIGGIIQIIPLNDTNRNAKKIQFFHQSYMEFFAAQYIYQEFRVAVLPRFLRRNPFHHFSSKTILNTMKFVRDKSKRAYKKILKNYEEIRRIFDISEFILEKVKDSKMTELILTRQDNCNLIALEVIGQLCENLKVISFESDTRNIDRLLEIFLVNFKNKKKVFINSNEHLDDQRVTSLTIKLFFELVLQESLECLSLFENQIEYLHNTLKIRCNILEYSINEEFGFVDVDRCSLLVLINSKPEKQLFYPEYESRFKSSCISLLTKFSTIKFLIFISTTKWSAEIIRTVEQNLTKDFCVCYIPQLRNTWEKIGIFNLRYIKNLPDQFLQIFRNVQDLQLINQEQTQNMIENKILKNILTRDNQMIHVLMNENLLKLNISSYSKILSFIGKKGKLKKIDLSKNSFLGKSLNDIFDAFQCSFETIEIINLKDCFLTVNHEKNLTLALQKFKRLKTLILTNNRLENLDFSETLQGLSNCSGTLEIIHMENCNLELFSSKKLKATFIVFSQLKHINISKNRFKNNDLCIIIEDFANCKSPITKLDLSSCGLIISEVKRLRKSLEKFNNLEHFDLKQNSFLATDLCEMIDGLIYCKYTIRKLDFSNCGLYVSDVFRLKDCLEKFSKLEILYLGENFLKGVDFCEIVNSLINCKSCIRKLNFPNCGLYVSDVSRLKNCLENFSKLEILGLGHNFFKGLDLCEILDGLNNCKSSIRTLVFQNCGLYISDFFRLKNCLKNLFKLEILLL